MNNFFYQPKIVIRSLRRGGMYSAINIGGLAISMATVILIMLWVWDELSYDRFHDEADRIYTVATQFEDGNFIYRNPGALATMAQTEFGEVEAVCRIRPYQINSVKCEGTKYPEVQCAFTDSTFFTIFGFPILKGEHYRLLMQPNDVVISQRLAGRFFGNGDPIGKTVELDGISDLQIVAVMGKIPQNTSLPDCDIILSFGSPVTPLWILEKLHSWEGGYDIETYLKLRPGANITNLERQFTQNGKSWNRFKPAFILQPLVDKHLYGFGKTSEALPTIRIFMSIAIVILAIACINYVNLVAARASRRNKEISTKKIIGARRIQLFGQFISESVLLFVAAMAIATVVIYLVFPVFNQISGKSIQLHWSGSGIVSFYALAFIAVIVLAGIYPAITLSSFKPLDMIHGMVNRKSGRFRKILVIFQFTASVVLIVGTIVLNRQMDYIRQKNLGYDKEHVLVMNIYDMNKHFEAVKTELLQHPEITGVTRSDADIMQVVSGYSISGWDGKTSEASVDAVKMRVDTSFLRVMRIPLIAGSGFITGAEDEYILNETAIAAMGITNPVGKKIDIYNGGTIVGIVKDFHFKNLHEKIEPMAIHCGYTSKLYIRTTVATASQAIAAAEKVWSRYNADYGFNYHFLDDTFERIYKSDIRTGRLFNAFAAIAIFISILGLFGLVTYTAETKTKEIGIRKVLGASVAGIVELLSKEFLILVGIAMLIAFPLAYYWLDRMLQDYAYRIDISWWMFAAAGTITIVLTLFTVGWQVVKAATVNPVKSLKTE